MSDVETGIILLIMKGAAKKFYIVYVDCLKKKHIYEYIFECALTCNETMMIMLISIFPVFRVNESINITLFKN